MIGETKVDITFHYYKMTLKFFAKAREAGIVSQSLEWNHKLATNIQGCMSKALDCAVEKTNGEKRVDVINGILPYIDIDEFKVKAFLSLAQTYFAISVNMLEQKKYKEALHFLKECYYPVEELKRLACGDDFVETEASVLEEDILLQTCVAESLQAIFTGKC